MMAVALSALGALVGNALAPRAASACQCEGPTWLLVLVGDEASDSSQAHDALWPKEASLSASRGWVMLGKHSNQAGVVGHASVRP